MDNMDDQTEHSQVETLSAAPINQGGEPELISKQDEKSQKKALKEAQKAKKKAQQLAEDEAAQANEIKYGIRFKLITVVSAIILVVVLVITTIATNNQIEAVLQEKEKQGIIIAKGLASAVKNNLLIVYAQNEKRLQKISTESQYSDFYNDLGISELLFEDIDQVITQPDVLYAYILGKHGIVLGHSNPDVTAYSKYKFQGNIVSYFEAYSDEGLTQVLPILKQIEIDKVTGVVGNAVDPKNRVEGIDFSTMLSFKNDPLLKDAIGELHIGISLETMNEQIFESKVEMQLIGAIAIILGVILAVVVATVIAQPIRKMIRGMQRVSQGDFNASVLVSAKDEVGLLSKTFNVMLKGLSLLVSPEVAQVVLSGGDLMKSGQKTNVTVLFSDIRAFTTISESLTPHEVVEMLNDYLDIMTEIIIKHGGVVDKFVGDEIFAVYGAPFEHPNHPLCATATAIEMGVDLAEHNKEREALGKLPIRIGIGVNTGDVIAGAMGSKKRIDFTSIGDAVNLGARLEGTNKVYGTLAIVSEFTYAQIRGDVVVRELDLIRVKGKNEPVTIYEAIALTETGHKKVQQYFESVKK